MIHFTLRMIVILMETIKDLYQTRLAKDGGTVRTIRGGCDYMKAWASSASCVATGSGSAS